MVKSRAKFGAKENIGKAPNKKKKAAADGEDILEFDNSDRSAFDNASFNGKIENQIITPMKSEVSDMNFDTPSSSRNHLSEPKMKAAER